MDHGHYIQSSGRCLFSGGKIKHRSVTQVASVGLTEEQAKEQGYEYKVRSKWHPQGNLFKDSQNILVPLAL